MENAWFDSYTAAAVWTKEAAKRKWLRHVAYLTKQGKHREYEERLYCGYGISQKNAFHHYQCTLFAMEYWPYAEFVAGPNVDGKRADMEMTVEYGKDDVMFAYVQMDCDTEDRKQWQERTIAPFGGTDDNLFVVVSTRDPRLDDGRLEELKKWSESVPNAYFTTLRSVQAEPYGHIWWHKGSGEWVLERLDDPDPSPEESTGRANGNNAANHGLAERNGDA